MNTKFTRSVIALIFIFCSLVSSTLYANNHIKTQANHISNYDILIYPNPSIDGFVFVKGDNIQTIEVTNLLGQVVFSVTKADKVKDKFFIELNKNKSGIYLLRIVFNDNYSIQRKIIIRK